MTDDTNEITEQQTKRGRKSRQEESGEAKPQGYDIRQRAVAILNRGSTGARLDPAELREKAEARMSLLVSRLEANAESRTHYQPAVLAQWKFELMHLQNGTWRPGITKPKGANASVAESIMGGAKMPTSTVSDGDRRLDAILEESR